MTGLRQGREKDHHLIKLTRSSSKSNPYGSSQKRSVTELPKGPGRMDSPEPTPGQPASAKGTDGNEPTPSPATTDNERAKLVLEESSKAPSLPGSCCGINKSLLPIKAFYFFFIGALGSLAPFIAILFKQYGLSPLQIGVIFGLRPIIGFISGPLWGVLADKFRKRRVLLLISILFWISVFVALAFIPPPERKEQCPEDMEPEPGLFKHRSHKMDQELGNVSHLNLTDEQVYLLREDYGWIYEARSLNNVFLLFMLLILLGEFVQSPTSALSDAATLELLGTENLDSYGFQRAWGSLGWAITSVSVGAIVSMSRVTEVVCSIPLHFSDYFSYVYVFATFMFFAFIFAALIPFPNEKEDKEKEQEEDEFSASDVFRVFCNVHYGSWLLTTFCVGMFNGLIWGFLNWHLDNLGADELLIGVSNVLKCVCEFFMYFLVYRVSELLGHMGLMYACLVSYAILFTGYSLLVNPWYVLILEVLHGCSFSCVWVSLTAYSTLAVPASSLATVQGILHGVYFGLGNGTGHLIGGLLIGSFGVPVTYSSMAVLSILTAVFLAIAQTCSVKPQAPYQTFDDR